MPFTVSHLDQIQRIARRLSLIADAIENDAAVEALHEMVDALRALDGVLAA